MKNCPKCLGPMGNYRYACKQPGCRVAGIPAEQEEASASGEAPRRLPAQSAPACDECGEAMTLRICPGCGFEMDTEDMRRGLMSVSVVGSSGCGKSNFIAVLINQLRTEMCKVYGCTLYPIGGDRTMDYYEREYHRPLYEQGICVPSTAQEDLNPLTYALLFSGKAKEAGSSIGLALYDSCGKKLENQHEMAAHNRSLFGSGGILLLLDPSQLPLIKDARKAKNMPVLEADAQALLLRAIHLIRNGLSIAKTDDKIPIPIAVCLTKLDIVYPHLDPASFIADTSRHLRRPMLNAADIASCSMEVMALLENWGGGELVRHVQSQFAEYSFFGFSSLGGEPGNQNEVDRISPHRVLDPLLWLLWRKQVLRAG